MRELGGRGASGGDGDLIGDSEPGGAPGNEVSPQLEAGPGPEAGANLEAPPPTEVSFLSEVQPTLDAAPTAEVPPELGTLPGEGADTREFHEVAAEIDSYEHLIEGVNPNFDPYDMNSAYAWNCGSCAIATELRVSGLDVGAQASAEEISTSAAMREATGRVQVAMDPAAIEQLAREAGPGFHSIVGFDWKDADTGHWITVATAPSGRVYALDGQCGRAMLFSEYVETYASSGENWDIGIAPDEGATGSEGGA